MIYCALIFIFVTVDHMLYSRQKHHRRTHAAKTHHKTHDPKRPPHHPKHLHRANVLVLSSTGRSGSSFLAETLASRGRNVYLVEPVRSLPEAQREDEHAVRDELQACFRCDLRWEFFHQGDRPSSSIRHPYTFKKDFKSVDFERIKGYCHQEPLRIVKTIRTRLAWVTELLQVDPNLKVIHLVRDPRGSLKSAAKVNWQMDPKKTCSEVMEDLQARKEMEKIYPNRYLFVKYEDLARDPFKKTVDIFRFLRGKSVQLPKRVQKYLWKHTTNWHKVQKPFGTHRPSEKIYQHWRNTISEAELNTYEAACGDVIHALGHRIFGSEKMARNLTLSLNYDV